MIQNSADTLRVYVNKYPPLAAFLFTLVIFSAVPVTIFLVYGSITAMVFFSIALIGFSVVEGVALLGGGGILLAVLGVILFITSIGFLWMSAIYLFYRGCCLAYNKIQQNLPSIPGVSTIVSGVHSGIQQATGGSSSQQPSYMGMYQGSQMPGTTTPGSSFNPS